MQAQPPSIVKPALLCGVGFGVAGAIPVLNWINCACCALIIGCGLAAAYLQAQQCKAAGAPFTPGAGAQVGLLAGIIYGVVSGVVSTLLQLTLGLGDWREIVEQLQQSGAVEPEVMDQIARFMESTGAAVLLLFGIFVALLLGAIFGTLGGLIGGSLFKAAGSATSSDVPPPPPPIQPGR